MERLMRSWWAMAATAAVILALVGGFGLPTLFPALRAPAFRLLLIGAIAAGLGGMAVWRWYRARRSAGQIGQELGSESDARAEESVLAMRMRTAIAQMQAQGGGQRNYLYARPWYLLIGPPGAGKTTALANSGLRFPWADAPLGGVGGTRDLDFWFADEAVLVDTAGRYTTQDSDRTVDAAGWERLLRLLRQTRPLEPVNGIIVTLSVDALLQADRAQLDAHIGAIRRRLHELGQILQCSVPAYLLLPKADLLAGFTEFFSDLSAEGRRAVLGATLDPAAGTDAAAFAAAFDQALDAIRIRTAKRLYEEPDQRSRGMILGFPAQLAGLRTRLAYLVEGVFRSDLETAPRFRGFYLASSTQHGSPFDQVLGDMATQYAMTPAAASARGRAFFLNRLLTEIVFPEAGMARASARRRRQRQRVRLGVLAGCGLVFLAMAGLWMHSFLQNKAYQNMLRLEARAAGEEGRQLGINLVEVRDTDPGLEQVLPFLDRLRELPGGFEAQRRGERPWTLHLGLFQSGHAETARLAYLEALQRVLLPRILLRAEQVLRDRQQQPAELYAPLKAYLMLGGAGPLDPRGVGAWIAEDWRSDLLAGADRAEVRNRLAVHVDALLSDPDLGLVWANRHAPLDGALITAARASLQGLPLADRAYAILKQRASAMGQPDWRADDVLAAGDRRAFRNGDAVLAGSIPWFFTRAGYERGYRAGLRDVQAGLDRDLWVLGPDARKRSIRDQLPAMEAAVAAMYARDYIAAWDGVLSALQPADYFRNPAALGALTRAPSPLKILLQEATRNTRFGSDRRSAPRATDAGDAIEAHFQPLHAFAGSASAGKAPVDALLEAVRQTAVANSAARAPGAGLSGGVVQGQLATALGELSTAAIVAPPQLKPFIDQATRSGSGAAAASAQDAIQQEYGATLLPACQSTIQGRYPFATAASQDADPATLHRVFAANGPFDAFVRDRLSPLLDSGSPSWRWNRSDPVAARFSPASAVQLQRAAALRDLLTGGLAFNVALETLSGGATAVELASGGTSHRLDLANRTAGPFLWNLSLLPSAQLVVLAGSREVRRLEARGPFAVFRLIGQGAAGPAGPNLLRVAFVQGAQSVVLRIELPAGGNPFGRAGPFSFRCPARL